MMSRLTTSIVVSALAVACSSESPSADTSPVVGTWRQTGSEERIGTAAWTVAKDVDCRTDNTEEYTKGVARGPR